MQETKSFLISPDLQVKLNKGKDFFSTQLTDYDAPSTSVFRRQNVQDLATTIRSFNNLSDEELIDLLKVFTEHVIPEDVKQDNLRQSETESRLHQMYVVEENLI